MDKPRFYDQIRLALFGGKLTKEQVNGIEEIFAGAVRVKMNDLRQLAYVLATAYHESARRMVPVRETLALSDDQVIARLDAAYAAKKMPQVKLPYWRRDEEGKAWFGRGLVQLTHKRNYEMMKVVSGYDLTRDPNLALQPSVSVEILLRGMILGSFAGAKLSDFFNDKTCDWVAARRMINGTDRASDIAKVALAFFAALQSACIEPKAV